MKKRVYHYTTKDAFDEIMRTKEIRPSSPWTTMDSTFGTGWYFTDLGPDKCDASIAYHCWRNADVINRIRYHLEFDIDVSILIPCRDHVYMVTSWDKNLITYIGSYETKGCSQKPCNTCETGKKYGIDKASVQ